MILLTKYVPFHISDIFFCFRIMLLHILGGILMMASVIQCCFITDCPRGMGKRSSLPAPLKPTTGPKWKYPQVSKNIWYFRLSFVILATFWQFLPLFGNFW